MRRWAAKGKFVVDRDGNGKRDYDVDRIRRSICLCGKLTADKPGRRSFVYARVSTGQQRGHLERQIEKIQERFGYGQELVTDIGSGLNFRRPGLNKILAAASRGEVQTVYIAYRDRLCRFAFELIETFLKFHGAEIQVADHDDTQTPERELAEDVLSIITVFGARLHGRRSGRGRKKAQGSREGHVEAGENEDPLLDGPAARVSEAVVRLYTETVQSGSAHDQGDGSDRLGEDGA
jgi:predicted site-specific integrase-resolvase